MPATDRELIDPEDGENRAVRAFLMMHGQVYTAGEMAQHMRRSGFPCVPDWADAQPGMHLTKGGAQLWLRMLFALEGMAAPTSAGG